MSLLGRIFAHPSLADAPPVLVDIGASGGVHARWRKFARYSIGVGFEPDSREAGALAPASRQFRQWISCSKLVVGDAAAREAELRLTKFPFCSSTLQPDHAALGDWAFAGLFAEERVQCLPATTVAALLQESGLDRVDWLKCDTQGTDLRIWQSLPVALRQQSLAVEFEPGLIDAYVGEDKFHQVLAAMEAEPMWLAELGVAGTPRGRPELLARRLGSKLADYYRKYGPAAAGWVNALYLRRRPEPTALRANLLLWVFATELNQHAFACEVAEAAAAATGDALAEELAERSVRNMRHALWATWPRWPGLLWGKVFGG